MTHFTEIEKEFSTIKERAGNPPYVACFGKTFVEETDPNYHTSREIGKMLVELGFGVLHGGYTGTMQAVSSGANEAIKIDLNKSLDWNVGVPTVTFDGNVQRTESTMLTSAENIFDRKRILVDSCDACIALPVGGVGTFLEVLEIFHLNQIHIKFGGKVRPIIFFGGKWKFLMETLKETLDLTGQADGGTFSVYVDSLEALKEELDKLQRSQ